MPHALTSNLLHCVFSTKDRSNSIPDPPVLARYLGGLAREKNIPLLIADGTTNHVPPADCPAGRDAASKSRSGSKGQQFTMVEPTWVEVCLAGGIRRVQRERGEQTSGDGIYRRAASASRGNAASSRNSSRCCGNRGLTTIRDSSLDSYLFRARGTLLFLQAFPEAVGFLIPRPRR